MRNVIKVDKTTNKTFVWIFSFLLIISSVSYIPLSISAIRCEIVIQSPACGIGEGILKIFLVIPVYIISFLALIISYNRRKHRQQYILTFHKIMLWIAIISLILNIGWLLFFKFYLYPNFLSPMVSVKACNAQGYCEGEISFQRLKKGCQYTDLSDQPKRCIFRVS